MIGFGQDQIVVRGEKETKAAPPFCPSRSPNR
jgi:hypothetical protein